MAMLGRNVRIAKKGSTLFIEIDDDAAPQLSKAHKSNVIATTNGNVAISTDKGTRYIGLNYFEPIDRANWDATAIEADRKAREERSRKSGKVGKPGPVSLTNDDEE